MPFFELNKFEELVSRFFLVRLLLMRGGERFYVSSADQNKTMNEILEIDEFFGDD